MAGTLVAYPVPSEPGQKPPSPVRIPGGHSRSVFSICFAVSSAQEPQGLPADAGAGEAEAEAAGEVESSGSPPSHQSDESPAGGGDGGEAAGRPQLGRRSSLQVRAASNGIE